MAFHCLYNKRQALTLVHGWGYTEGNLPVATRRTVTLHIPVECRTGTDMNATIEWAGKNLAGHRLYRVTFVTLQP